MRQLLVYIKEYKKPAVLSPVFKMLEALLELFIPVIVAAIIDKGIAHKDVGYIVRLSLLLLLLAAVGLSFSVTAQYFAAKAAVGFAKKIRHVLFKHITELSYSEIDKTGTATMITRLTSDLNQVQEGVNLTLRLLLRSPFIIIGALIMAFTIDVKAALVFAVTIPILACVIFGIMLYSIPLYKKVQERLDRVLGITRENLTGVRVIRAFCKEKEETEHFQDKNQHLTDMQKYVGRVSALLNPVTFVIVNIAIIVLVWVGAIRVEAGILTQGAVVALYNYISQILVELIKLASLVINITRAVACGNRIQSVLTIEPGISDDIAVPVRLPDESSYAVEFSDVGMSYQEMGGNVLEHVSFRAEKGETIGIIGGTGSGKSSLINLIPRFYECSQGEVLVNGVNVNDYPLSQLRGLIGIVPQKAVLFSGTVRENMQWGKMDASDEEIFEALKIAQLSDMIANQNQGLDFHIGQSGKNLSGGQRQRFTIARALVRKPEILILDDSSSALDFATDAALRKAIHGMENRPILFLVSQRTSSIMNADRIIVLDDGRVAGIGKHDELLRDCEVYKEIYDSQFQKRGA